MTPPPSLEAISRLTVRNVAHMVGFFVLAIIGTVTSILELLLSLHKYAVTMQSALETVLGLCNAMLQAAYVLEKLVQLHRTFVTARDPQILVVATRKPRPAQSVCKPCRVRPRHIDRDFRTDVRIITPLKNPFGRDGCPTALQQKIGNP